MTYCATFNWIIRNKDFIKGVDYYFLQRLELRDFKIENPKMSKLGGALIVVTKTGFEKIADIYGNNIKIPQNFLLANKRYKKIK